MDTRPATLLRLTLTNPADTRGGGSLEHWFDADGGSIGSAANDTWRLSSHRTGAVAGHAEIRLVDGEFCLIDRSGRTYVNSASEPVGRGRRARLKHGDTLSIGRLRVRAELRAGGAVADMDEPEPEHDQLVNGALAPLARASAGQAASGPREPLAELAPTPVDDADPLGLWLRQAGDTAETALLADTPGASTSEIDVTDQYRENRDVALGLPLRKAQGDRMFEQDTPTRTADQSRQHISAAPLLRAMDAELEFADSGDMQQFLEEAGQTLKAAVAGLLALHQGEDQRHQALRTRLQPIEDNPLRLGDGYPDTIQTLFASRRSPVHLSAPAAVRESLESLQHHQLATQAAIQEALEAILHAFSPEALLRRFHGYRRGLGQSEDEGRWAWEMYQHYYRELKSSRQRGFERLFQEVFDQAYDQNLRQLQRDALS
jgi:type VI secretion system protein ImpI